MLSELASISPEEKIEASRKLDIFHHWDSLDEKRLCIRCGQIISGHEIKVFGRHCPQGSMRLECPTAGCAAVPIEWLMLEPPDVRLPESPPEPDVPAGPPPIFGFLRVSLLLL